VACGGGALSAWLADHTTAEVVGVDLSGGQLAHARRWVAGGRRPNLRFLQHDIMHLDELAEPPFDAAICLDAACYLPDRRVALGQIASRLRPGGRLLLVDWCRTQRPAALQRELILEPLCRSWAIADLETAAGYRRLFAAAGLRIHRLEDLSDRVVPNWERAYRRRCTPWPSRSTSASCYAWPPTRSPTAASSSRQPRTNSRSRCWPRPRQSPGCCAT
jgi:SAM-dependent methyltransferase